MDIKNLNELLNSYNLKCECVGINDTLLNTEYIIKPFPAFSTKKLKNKICDLQLFFDNNIILSIENNQITIQETKPNRKTIDFFNTFNELDTLKHKIPILLGIDGNGNKKYIDLVEMPHLLIAGSTGSGKSIFLHNIILSILNTHKSKLLLIDLKKVELSQYNGLPALYNHNKAITDYQETESVLNNVVDLMLDRYKYMELHKIRDFEQLKTVSGADRITIIIDELADLMLNRTTRKNIENNIVRIAQLGRACGIHLIVATQRPDTSVVTGLIKANIPSRISFCLSSAIDSRTILNQSGAERLNKHGDGLFLPIGSNSTIRFQSCYIDDLSIQNYVEQHKPKYNKPVKKGLFRIFK